MATVSEVGSTKTARPELHSGDCMSREEFHRIYEQMPDHFRAELVGGIVYVSSPLTHQHSIHHIPLGSMFFSYEANTPGVECGDNATILLGDDGEPQPDLFLRVLPEYGGRSQTTADDYVAGPPELIAEIAHSSLAIDLHSKREDYARHGVLEYLVVSLRESQVHWFDLRADQPLAVDSDGIIRIRSFPGLWIDTSALLSRDYHRLMAALQQGLAGCEHAAFVEKLSAARAKRPRAASD